MTTSLRFPMTLGNMRANGVCALGLYCGLAVLALLATLMSARAYEMPYDPYPWCAEYYFGRDSFTECGFRTIEQCRASVSGVGGSCEPNQFYNPRRSSSKAHRRKRR
jgi:Protein of unknown function (DUF3551)